MQRTITPLHIATTLAGGTMLAVITHANVHAAGLTGPDAYAVYALGAGIFAGSLAIGGALAERRFGTFSLILLALLAGEGFNLYQTAARQVLAHEEAMSEFTQRSTDLQALQASLSLARTAAPETARLITAREALARTQAAIETERLTGCKKECLRLKQQVLPANEAEITAALSDAMTSKAARIAALEAQIKAAPAPPQTLGDKAGIGQWVFDLLSAALKSLALNGLACGLIAYGGQTLLLARPGTLSRGASDAHPHPRGASRPVAAGAVVDFQPLVPRIIVADDSSADPAAAFDAARLRTMLAKPLPDLPGRKVADVIAGRRGPDNPDPRQPDGPGGRPPGGVPGPSKSGPGLSKADALDDIMQRLADGRTIQSQDELAEAWNRPKQTVSDWMREWRRIGIIPQPVQSGRCKVTAKA